jgi:PilZ domain
MPERRKCPRSRVFKSAKIVVGTSSVFDCVVRNLTNSGAFIEVSNAVSLPEVMDITFDDGRTFRPSRSKWRTLNAIGVQFFEPPRGVKHA